MNTHERKLMLDLVSKFCDGSELSRDEISLMQNQRVVCTEGKGHQYALTEFGRQFMPQSLFYKNRERNLRFKAEDSSQCPDTDDSNPTFVGVLTNGRPPVDAKAAIWRYVRGLQLAPDQRQVLLADELIEPNQQGGTVITAKGEALYKATGATVVPVSDYELNSIIGQPIPMPLTVDALFGYNQTLPAPKQQEAQNQQSRSGLDMLIKSGPTLRETAPAREHGPLDSQVGGSHYKDMKIQPIEFIEANNIRFLEGCIIKRAARHDKPTGKGAQDLRKIIHEAQLLLELRYGEKA